MIVVLDTDHLTIIQRQTEPGYTNLRLRLNQSPAFQVYSTIISFEEQMRGWLAVIAKTKEPLPEVMAYHRLNGLLRFYQDVPVLDYNQSAATHFAQLRAAKVRVGSMDLKIAAIAITQSALLLSRNLKDFQQVPGLQVEDWTI